MVCPRTASDRIEEQRKSAGRSGGFGVRRGVRDDDDTPIQPSEPVAARGRGMAVEGYEGLRAGAAIAAVRRLGLRPSLERVEGYEPGIHGFVVGQDPSTGAEVQAGGQVVLFIAAPARTVISAHPDPAEDAGADGPDADRDADTDTDLGAGAETDSESAPGEPEEDTARGGAELPVVDGEIDFERLWVGEAGYEDETLQVHEIGAPEEWTDEPTEEYERFLDEGDPDSGGSPGVAEPAGVGRSNQRRVAPRAYWRSAPRAVRWGVPSLLAVTLLVPLVGIVDSLSPARPRGAPALTSSSPLTSTQTIAAAGASTSTTLPAGSTRMTPALRGQAAGTRHEGDGHTARPPHPARRRAPGWRGSSQQEPGTPTAPAREAARSESASAALPAREVASSAPPPASTPPAEVSPPARSTVPLDARSPAQMSPEEHLEAEFGP